jgi:hypothetical protein
LRVSGVDAGNGLREAGRSLASSCQSSARLEGRQFRQDALDQFRLQPGKLTIKNLRYRALNDLLELLAIGHRLENLLIRESSIPLPAAKDAALIADYTALVCQQKGTSVTFGGC